MLIIEIIKDNKNASRYRYFFLIAIALKSNRWV